MTTTREYAAILESGDKAPWHVEDVIGPDKPLDFGRPFLPETLARADGLAFLSREEKLRLNQVRAAGYLRTFGLVEEFILPFVMDHARPRAEPDVVRTQALLRFAAEEAKHIRLFRTFSEEFGSGFGSPCGGVRVSGAPTSSPAAPTARR